MKINLNNKTEYEIIYSHLHGFRQESIVTVSNLIDTQLEIKPKFVGICGSDLHLLEKYMGNDLRLGHEWVGVVKKIGPKVTKFQIGDIVTSPSSLGCGTCPYCMQETDNLCDNPTILSSESLGALRSTITFKENDLIALAPKNLISATLFEVIALGEEAVELIPIQPSINHTILIIGSGPVGLMTALAAKRRNLDPIIVDINLNRIQHARKININNMFFADMLTKQSFHNYFDIIIDASGDQNNGQGAWKYLNLFGKKKFTAIMIGKYSNQVNIIPDSFGKKAANLIWMRSISKKRLNTTISQWTHHIDKIASEIITHKFKITELDCAFETACNKSISCKVVIEIE